MWVGGLSFVWWIIICSVWNNGVHGNWKSQIEQICVKRRKKIILCYLFEEINFSVSIRMRSLETVFIILLFKQFFNIIIKISYLQFFLKNIQELLLALHYRINWFRQYFFHCNGHPPSLCSHLPHHGCITLMSMTRSGTYSLYLPNMFNGLPNMDNDIQGHSKF